MTDQTEAFPQTPLDKAGIVLEKLLANVGGAKKKLEKAIENLEYAEMLVRKQEEAMEALADSVPATGGLHVVDAATGEVVR